MTKRKKSKLEIKGRTQAVRSRKQPRPSGIGCWSARVGTLVKERIGKKFLGPEGVAGNLVEIGLALMLITVIPANALASAGQLAVFLLCAVLFSALVFSGNDTLLESALGRAGLAFVFMLALSIGNEYGIELSVSDDEVLTFSAAVIPLVLITLAWAGRIIRKGPRNRPAEGLFVSLLAASAVVVVTALGLYAALRPVYRIDGRMLIAVIGLVSQYTIVCGAVSLNMRHPGQRWRISVVIGGVSIVLLLQRSLT
jgi:hypothetical protein